MDDPEEVAAIAEAGRSPAFLRVVDELTAPDQRIRGCQVDPARPNLQALQNVLEWTLGGYDTRPTEEVQQQKHYDRLQVLLTYRQPPMQPGQPPHVVMYDYLCDTLFGLPMRPVGPEVEVPNIEDLEGRIVRPAWLEVDWELFEVSGAKRPDPVLRSNRYPYQLPSRPVHPTAHEFQRETQHWILWYFHRADEPPADPPDEVIDCDIRCGLLSVVTAEGFDAFDYIWYRNPGMSVPDMFHVQVFWIVPEA